MVDVDQSRTYNNPTINNNGPSDIDRAMDRNWDLYYQNINRIPTSYPEPTYTPSDYSDINWGL